MNANDVLGGLVEKATKGPWVLHNDDYLCVIQVGDAYMPAPYQPPNGRGECAQHRADGAVIVAAVNALPLLLEVVKVSRKFNESCICHLAQGCAACELKTALARLDEGVRP